jgi:hypothetical protein
MMMTERYQPKQFAASSRNTCAYCHRSPALWHYHGSEKICVHCGTRVYPSASRSRYAKTAQR